MVYQLPSNLHEAEEQLFNSIQAFYTAKSTGRISVNLKFEGLKLLPLSYRLLERSMSMTENVYFLWPDAGAAALAKNQYSQTSSRIYSFKDFISTHADDLDSPIVLAVEPKHFDYEEFESVANCVNGLLIMLNGQFDDSSVGIGSVGRERRKGFISTWDNVYWLEPLNNGALMHQYSSDWSLYRSDPDGYRLAQSFTSKPSQEEIIEHLSF